MSSLFSTPWNKNIDVVENEAQTMLIAKNPNFSFK